MKLLVVTQRRMRRTMMMDMVPMLLCNIAAILLISASVIAFAYYLSPISAYSQAEPNLIEASGHFANNQIENDSVSWIQGGLWHLAVYNSSSPSSSSNNSSGAKAIFSGNFTMVKPDGSQTHEHSVNDFRSNNVIITGGDMIITGIGNIYENARLKYRDVPITVHLMGKEHVLGLIIDPVTTDRHFVSNHEMFGTLIKGTGLENIEKTLPKQKNSKGMNMNGMTM